MHVYRYQYKNYNRSHDKRKKRRRILPVTILIVAAAVILSGGVRLDPGELGFLLQEEIVGFFLPQACGQAQGTAELTIADRLFAHFFLLPEESGVSADYQTQVESDWSYEAILAREAADENYVDAATGEVIMTQEAAEQSSTSMREGETKVNRSQASPNHLDERTFIRALPQKDDAGYGLVIPPLRQNHAVGDDLCFPCGHGVKDGRTLLH